MDIVTRAGDRPDRTVIALIPVGQSIELFTAVGGLLNAALGGARLAAGDGRDVMGSVVLDENITEQDAIARLRAATRALGDQAPQVLPEDLADLDANPGTVGPITEDADGGLSLSIGGVEQEAREVAEMLLAAFIPAFQELAAPNYLEFPAVDMTTGQRYAVIVVKPNGLTPNQARQRAEAEAERLRARIAELEAAGA